MTARAGASFQSARQRSIGQLVLSGPTEGRAASIAFAARLFAGAIFIAFGVGKFLNHGSEPASFQAYGLPSPNLVVFAIGTLELVGGVAPDARTRNPFRGRCARRCHGWRDRRFGTCARRDHQLDARAHATPGELISVWTGGRHALDQRFGPESERTERPHS